MLRAFISLSREINLLNNAIVMMALRDADENRFGFASQSAWNIRACR